MINAVEDVVEEMVQGIVASHPSLVRIRGYHILVRADYAHVMDTQVALISGGGSGHEPAHAGFVGAGMLSAAVCGGVFASPSVDSILAAIRTVTGARGCLLIVKNYTGDRLNFGLAAEQARSEGLAVKMVIVGDDVAVNAGDESDGSITGRRGLAGTLYGHKCAGAAAAAGESLDRVFEEASGAAAAVASMGCALTTCTVPGGQPSERIGTNEMELGLGIHGEPGRDKLSTLPVDAIVQRIVAQIDRILGLKAREDPKRVVLMVNNLGGSPLLELYIAARAAHVSLEGMGCEVVLTHVGPFMTSLEMQGMMLTVCLLDDATAAGGAQRLARLLAPTDAPAWPRLERGIPNKGPDHAVEAPAQNQGVDRTRPQVNVAQLSAHEAGLRRAITAVADALEAAEPDLTAMDRIVGDGDCGRTFARGAAAVKEDLAWYPVGSPSELCCAIADSIRRSMGGSSGAVLDIMFRAAAAHLRNSSSTNPDWAAAFAAAVSKASFYGGAKVGFRTMLDALIPASTVAAQGGSWADICLASDQGVEATKLMRPLAGRSSYLQQDVTDGTADPGAAAMAIVLNTFARVLNPPSGAQDS